MKYQVTLSARDANGIMREVVVVKTYNLERARETVRQISDALPQDPFTAALYAL